MSSLFYIRIRNKPKILHLNPKSFGSFNNLIDVFEGADAALSTSSQQDIMDLVDGVKGAARNNYFRRLSVRNLVDNTGVKNVSDTLAEKADQGSVAENRPPITGNEADLLVVKLCLK